MGDETTVRRCTRSDVEAVLRLWSLARGRHASTPDRREEVEALVSDGPATLLVAETDEEVVGAIIAGWDGWRGDIYRLAVREDYRRQGVLSNLELTQTR
jgi:ribosomal protein S18 acetylase RimI-like enzyme